MVTRLCHLLPKASRVGCCCAPLVAFLAAVALEPALPSARGQESAQLVAPPPEPAWTETLVPDEARQFWSFQPLSRPEPPGARDEAWCRTAVDRFIRRKLEDAQLAPNPPAAKRQLIRRAYFDLIGLPPPPEEIVAFEQDTAPDAYERLIDRLLANPRYGERWARHWLDLVRFAESHGFEHDYDRPTAYHYRDFVIQALNQDMPYDRFVRWQIAGDELAPHDNLALSATGFLAAGVHSTQITANEVEKHRYDELDDIVATIGTAMLGLSVGCARCHDHKYDPIPQADYYRLVSSFTTTVRSEVDLDLDPEGYRIAKAAFDAEHAPLLAARERYEAEVLPAQLQRWEEARDGRQPEWIVLEAAETKSAGGATFERLDDGSLAVSGKNEASDAHTFIASTQQKTIAALRIEALPAQLPGSPTLGRAKDGSFTLTRLRVAVASVGSASDAAPQPVEYQPVRARAASEAKDRPVSAALDDDKNTGWSPTVHDTTQAAVFEFEPPAILPPEATLTVTLEFQRGDASAIARPRIAVASQAAASLGGEAMPENVLRHLDLASEDRSPEQVTAIRHWYRTLDPVWRELDHRVRDHLRHEPQPRLAKALVSSEGLPALRLHSQGADFFPETYFLRRGDPNLKEGVATPGYLQVLMPAPNAEQRWMRPPPPGWRTSFRRTSLADWMTDYHYGAGNLLARVIVNRLWQHHLGRGIVATPSDFGTRGELPSHPELLDWLAGELIRQGWRLKPIHRLIMTSAVYVQGSQADDARAAKDLDNQLYWRRTPRRLEAEVIRDAMLAASGTLEHTMFGPGTLDELQQRRSIYFTLKRSQLSPMMQVFDAPDCLQGIPERATTTVAPQALLLINGVQVRRCADALAERVLSAGGNTDAMIDQVYLAALGRPPLANERDDARAFLTDQTKSYGSENAKAATLAWADFCQAIFCLNEFVYVE